MVDKKEKLTTEQKKQVKKEVDKKVKQEIKEEKKKIEKEVNQKVKQEVEQKVEKEVEKRLHEILIKESKEHAKKFKKEFKKHSFNAITAAFAFLIALSWRTPIQDSVDKITKNLGLAHEAIYYEYIAAIFITLVAVLFLMVMSSWSAKGDNS